MNDKTETWSRDTLEYSACSDVGMRRQNNQDSFCVSPATSARIWRSRGHAFVVADGMGAHKAGELASKMAVETIPQAYLKRSSQQPADAIRDAILDAHEAIRKRGKSDPSFRDMGTTCETLVILPDCAYVGHVGDSRIYRMRGNVVEQLTFDHSLIWEVKNFPNSHSAYRNLENIPKNIITRSLGPTEDLVVDIEGPLPLMKDDVFLMCSDGLSGKVDDDELGQIMALLSPADATESLVNLANLRGGPDNITVVVARVKSVPTQDEIAREFGKIDRTYEKRAPLSGPAWCAFTLATIFALFGIGAFFMNFSGHIAAGVVSLILALASATLGLFFGRETFFPNSTRRDEQKRGKGPYARASAAPTEAFSVKVAEICNRLCEAVEAEKRYEPDWEGVRKERDRALAFANERNYARAICSNLGVINYIMREVRNNAQNQRKTQRHETSGTATVGAR